MPSYNVYSGDSSVLYQKINSTQTTGVKIAPMNINGSLVEWANTAGVIEVSEQGDATLKREWIYYTNSSIDSTTKVATLTGVVRGVSSTSSDVTSGGTGVSFSKGATVRFVTFHDLLNKKANTDRVNTFSASQTIDNNVSLQFEDSTCYIKTTDSGANLKFKDGSTSEQTLSQLAAAAGTDHKVLVSSNDTTANYLNGKLVAGAGITLTENNDGADETLSVIAANTVATGHTGLSSVTAGNILLGNGTSAMTLLAPGTSGNVPVSNGSTFVMGTPPSTSKIVAIGHASSSTSGTSATDFSTTYTIPANDLVDGVGYRFKCFFTSDNTNGITFQLKLGSTVIDSFNITPSVSSSGGWFEGVIFGTAPAGASVTVRGNCVAVIGNGSSGRVGGSGANPASASVATNGTLVFKLTGTNATSGATTISCATIEKFSTTAF